MYMHSREILVCTFAGAWEIFNNGVLIVLVVETSMGEGDLRPPSPACDM